MMWNRRRECSIHRWPRTVPRHSSRALPRAAAGALSLAALVLLAAIGSGGPLAAQTASAAGKAATAAPAPAPAAAEAPTAASAPAGAPGAPAAGPAAPAAATPADAPAPPRAESLLRTIGDKLSFHAYVNQAYAISRRHQIFGIPRSGTSDYRTVAMQVRYALTGDDAIVTQVSNFRYGASTVNKLHGDVELELAFYQHVFADSTAVKVGKMQLPVGMYNEIRDVGTLLPFYAPPVNVYLESYTSRSIEGVMVSRSFAKGSQWSVDADLYYGGWRRIEQLPATGQLADARAEKAIGVQVFVNTPLQGLRCGGAYAHFDTKNRLGQVHALDPAWVSVLSLDGTFERFFVRGEFLYSELPYTLAPGVVTPRLKDRTYWFEAGLNLTSRLSLNLEADFGGFDSGLDPSHSYVNFNRDYAIGFAYKFRPEIVAKIEGHRSTGSFVENEPTTAMTRTYYGIASLAVSF